MLIDKFLGFFRRENIEYEPCVICWKLTNVRKDTPVDVRRYRVDGSGELCPECWVDVYGLNPIEMMRARLWLNEMGIRV